MKKLNMKQFKGGPGNIFLMALFFLFTIFIVLRLADFSHRTENISYSAFLKKLETNQVQAVEVTGSEIRGLYRDGRTRFETVIPNSPKIWDLLKEHNVETNIAPAGGDFSFWQFIYLLPFLLTLIGIWYLFRQSRNSGGNGGNIFSMSKSKAKMFMPSQIKVNFDSVAGATEAKRKSQILSIFSKILISISDLEPNSLEVYYW